LAGFDEAQIKQAWVSEDREPVLLAALGDRKHSKTKTKSVTD
jgi:hypothetical protein